MTQVVLSETFDGLTERGVGSIEVRELSMQVLDKLPRPEPLGR